MNVHTGLWCLINFVFHNFEHVGFEAQCIDWLSSCTRVSLHCRCHKTLREEEGCNPESLRRSLGDPAADEFDTFNKVQHPRRKRLQRWITDGNFHPWLWHLVIEEAVEDVLQLRGHNLGTFSINQDTAVLK